MLKADGSGNFNEAWDGIKDSTNNGYTFAEKMVARANEELTLNARMFRQPEGIETPVRPTKLQYILTGIYFDRNDQFQNDDFFSGWSILEKYGVRADSEINVFSIVPERSGSGIANEILYPEAKNPVLATKISYYANYVKFPDWGVTYAASTMNHEIGHLLGLRHTWNEDDDCDDTPKGHRVNSEWLQCWGFKDKDTHCGDWKNISNNIMDYNEHFPHAYTPCQLNILHTMLRTSATNFVAQVGGNPPLKGALQVINQQGRIIVDARASFNDVAYTIEVVDLKKNPRVPTWVRRKVLKSDWKMRAAERVELSELMAFKKGHHYFVRLRLRSAQEEEQVITQTIEY